MEQEKLPIGSIGWFDLTTVDADATRDFYSAVTGWVSQPISMGSYNDYAMAQPENNIPVAGICHAAGANTDIPAGWILYITVADIQASVDSCKKMGGTVLTDIKAFGDQAFYCFLRDPSGAAFAVFQQK
ncbi:MAG: VOC family protein [Ignavibacteria bacterium]|nr:VOC family protein [Ignavibacteria bacterium]